MGGGKETPRQKMIGMMYLVLTALLAMNVSKQILHGYVAVNESIEKSKENMHENNERVLKSFEEMAVNTAAAKPYLEKAVLAQKEIMEVYKYIGEMRTAVIAHTEKKDTKTADTMRLDHMEKTGQIDNYDAPSGFLIGSEAVNPKKDKLSAYELKGKLKDLHSKLVGILDDMQKDTKTQLPKDDYESLKKKLKSGVEPDETPFKEGNVTFGWEAKNFYHLPEAAVVTTLNMFQANLKNVEADILQVFSGASGKLAIKFDHLEAKVIAPSSYIQAGQPYVADIMLAASSSKLGEGDLEFHVGGSYDSITKKFTPGIIQKIENGMGKYSAPTGGQGEQTFTGVIKFKKPNGDYDYYKFSQMYMVAAPAVAIEPEKMNVFYVGVDNPIAVSAAGISPTNLIVNATGGGVTKTGGAGGKFILRFTTVGECMISTSAKTADGTKPQGPPKKFRVKRIPDPVCKLGGKPANGVLEFKKIELASIGGVGADLPGFDFDVRFPVVSFVFSANVKGNIKEFTCNGANLSPEAKSVLQSLNAGGKAFFENVKVKAPDGTIRTLATASLKVK